MTARLTAFCLFAVLLVPLGDVRNRGAVMLIDPSYEAETVTFGEGLGADDGILVKQGKFYFADEGGVAVRTWTKAEGLKTLCDASCGTESPEDLVVDADGNIYFTDDDAGGLWHIDPQGKVRLLAGKEQGLISTEGIALAPDGTILVGDGEQHQVYRVTKQGQVSVFLGRERGIWKPESMVFDERGNLYIADNQENKIYLLDPAGRLRVLLDERDGVASPETIFYAHGSLYINDNKANDNKAGKLLRYTPGQRVETLAVFTGRLKNLQGLCVSETGDIYVTVQDLKRNKGTFIHIVKVE